MTLAGSNISSASRASRALQVRGAGRGFIAVVPRQCVVPATSTLPNAHVLEGAGSEGVRGGQGGDDGAVGGGGAL